MIEIITMVALVTCREIDQQQVLLMQRTTGLVRRTTGAKDHGEWLVWAVLGERPKPSNFDGFGDCQGIFQLNAEIAHRTVHLGLAQ